MTIYLDCNATTPIDPEALQTTQHFLLNDFGNAGSAHSFGACAAHAVREARKTIATALQASPREVVFTSGATESDNLAILGLEEFANQHQKRHIITTTIEHKAILASVQALQQRGFEITFIPPHSCGQINPADVAKHLRPDTLLVSVMHVNNETGILQPIEAIAQHLQDHDAFFHTDAAQSFGKLFTPLQNPRIDLISISAHKAFGPKGVGALITRRRGRTFPPLSPLLLGGGQERGLRSGTLPVALIAGFGKAIERAYNDHDERRAQCKRFGRELRDALKDLNPVWVGDCAQRLYNTACLRFPGIDAHLLKHALKDLIAFSSGSACSTDSPKPSHVALSLGLNAYESQEVIRLSWCHMTPTPNWDTIRTTIRTLQTNAAQRHA